MTVLGVLGGGNDGIVANTSAVPTSPAAGAQVGDVHVFATTFPGCTANTASNEWSPFTLTNGPLTAATTMRCYLFGKTLTQADLTDGTNTTTWSGSTRSTAA